MNSSFSYQIPPIFLSILLFLLSCSPNSHSSLNTNNGKITSIHLTDRNGLSQTIATKDRLRQFEKTNFLEPQPYQKVTRTYGRNKQGDTLSYITSYHPNGLPKQYLEAINSQAKGLYREWHPNGVLKLEADLMSGVADLNENASNNWQFDNISQVWDDEGNLIAKISYDKGKLHGTTKHFHSNGKLWKTVPYEKGVIHGTLKIFQRNGLLLTQSDYSFGERDGMTIRFWNDEQVAAEEHYSHDLLKNGHYFNPQNILLSEVIEGNGERIVFGKNAPQQIQTFQNGVLEGKIKVFGESQQLVKTFHIKNHLKHGEEIIYFPNSSQPKISLFWHKGLIQGLVKTWYSNGIPESHREVNRNKNHGLFTTWYRNGNVMFIEEYSEDKLVKGKYFHEGEDIPYTTVKEGNGTATIFDPEGNLLRKIVYQDGKPAI